MAHSLALASPSSATPITPSISKSIKNTHFPSTRFLTICATNNHQHPTQNNPPLCRRGVTLGLAGAVLGLRLGNQSASAAARRPPPPPPTEKNDPNLSGLQAKVLASKKRKEALKEEVAKLRERGRPILEATTPTPTPTPTE